MADVPKDLRSILFGMGARWHAVATIVLECLGIVFLIVGIVADAMNKTLGLETTHWFIMAITFFVWGLSAWFCAYFGAKEG